MITCLVAPAVAGPSHGSATDEVGTSSFDLYWTQFLGSEVSGDGDDELQYGGKLDAFARIDGRDIGLWNGISINIRPEFRYGDSVSDDGSPVLMPPHVAMNFPSGDGEDFDLALNVTQMFGRTSLTAGKINMLDTTQRIPLVGGAGVDGFLHAALAAPPSLLTPPTILGALLTTPTAFGSVTLGLWDTASAVNEIGLDDAFEDGVAGMLSLTVPLEIGGRRGFHQLSVFANDKRGIDLDDIPELFLPAETEVVLGEESGAWYVKYAFQHYLTADATHGWGVFGHAGIWDGNPSALRWNMALGIGGRPPFESRPDDRFGIGYFRVSFSDALQRGLAPILALDDEQGVELFYTWQLGWLRLTANAQVVESGIEAVDTMTIVGMRARIGL